MYDVIYTAKLPDPIEIRLHSLYQSQRASLKNTTPDEFVAAIGSAKVLVTVPGDPVNAELIAKLPASVGLIACFSTGTDHVDLRAASSRNIQVSNTPDVLTDATADIAMLLILAAARGANRAVNLIRKDSWKGWQPADIFGTDIRGKTLGILGFGRIGQALAHRAHPFGMHIVYHSRRESQGQNIAGARYESDIDTFFRTCDIFSLHAPSTTETRAIINREAIGKMKTGAVLVNTARGDLVDDDALIEALYSGKIGAVGLDVYNNEPNIDPRYRNIEQAFLLPHIGSATHETRLRMGMKVLNNIEAYFKGETLPDPVAPPLN